MGKWVGIKDTCWSFSGQVLVRDEGKQRDEKEHGKAAGGEMSEKKPTISPLLNFAIKKINEEYDL